MTAVNYERRPHRDAEQGYEYTGASVDEWITWIHVGYVLLLLAALGAFVLITGGIIDIPLTTFADRRH